MGSRFFIAALALMVSASVAARVTPAQTPPWLEDPFPSTYVPAPRSDVMIRNATILDGAGNRIDDGDMLLRDGKIAAIGRALPNIAGVREIDAKGKWVTPGVIDVHSHDGTYVLPQTSIDHDASDVGELSLNAADLRIETGINPQDVAFARARENGVTTIQILPGSSPIFSGRSVVLKPVTATTIAAMKFPGAAPGFKMACGENPKEQAAANKEGGPTSRAGEVAYIRQAFLDAQVYLDQWNRYRRGLGKAPDRDLKKEALAGILAGDIHVHMHCYRADDMATMMAVAREFGFRIAAFHHASEAYKIPDLLRAAGTCSAVWGDWWGFKMEVLDGIRANAAILDRAGACVMMHSDSAGSGQRLNIEAAKAAAAGRRVGIVLPPERIIRWITSEPATLLGLGKRIGTLAPGYDANVVIWSGNPFSIYTRTDLVLIDGSVAFDRHAPLARPASDFELGRPTMEVRP